MNTLLDMLTYKRPHGSKTEELFIHKYIHPLLDNPYVTSFIKDEIGNYIIQVIQEKYSRTLFTAHLDTIHSTEGKQVVYLEPDGFIKTLDGECLGADDGAGIWLLIQMINRGIPGTYLFTRGEERGGIGSRMLADTYPEFLENYDRAIAFDRRGTYSVITHQAYTRCCSDIFAEALADQLNQNIADNFAMMVPDNTGIYTDTAEFIDLIPECTNISIGYYSEHSKKEILDSEYLVALLDAVTKIDFEALPVVRVPFEEMQLQADEDYFFKIYDDELYE